MKSMICPCLPLPDDSVESLKAVLLEAFERNSDAPDNALVIIDALPRLMPGTSLFVSWTARYMPPPGGGLLYQSAEFELTDELLCSAAKTYQIEGSGSDTSSRSVFECRPDEFMEGDIIEWIELAASLEGSTISISVDLPQTIQLKPEPEFQAEPDDDLGPGFECDDFDPRRLSSKAQRTCGLLPTAAERAKENADMVSAVLQDAMNDIVAERGRVKGGISTLQGLLVLFILLGSATYLLGGSSGWIIFGLAAFLEAALLVEGIAKLSGIDLAITGFEGKLRLNGVSIKWERQANQIQSVVRWKTLETVLAGEAKLGSQPDC